jgi:high-affinity K+ transport system ATPase subunit B
MDILHDQNSRVDVILVSVKVVFWVKAISYTFFAHYCALPSNTTGWNPINRYHATTFLYLSLTPVIIFCLLAVLLVSVLSRLRFVNGIVRVVVSYFVIHYCFAVYSQYYFI